MMATATKAAKGFDVRCPFCGQENSITVDVHCVNQGFTCTACETVFGADEVREEFAKWTTLLTWLETAPEV